MLALPAAIAVALCAGPSAAAAQLVNFRHYTNAEGLPQTQVLAVHQDRRGYMWFATYGGLTRFNGREFLTYTKEDGLSSNTITDVAEDAAGRLLVATQGGVCVFDAGRFQCIREQDGLVHDNTRSVAADGAGGMWVGTIRGLSHVRGDTIRNYTTADGLPANRIARVVVDSARRVWVATEKGLARFDGERFVLDAPDVIGNAAVQFIVPTRDGLLVGARGRLYLRRGNAVTPVADGAIPDGMMFADGAVSADGTIWVATRDGALRIRDGRVERLGTINGLLTQLTNRVAIDREGNVWFGTESGASKHVPGPFRTYTAREGLPSAFVRAMAMDEAGDLWVGTRKGVAVRDLAPGSVPTKEQFRTIPLPGVPDERVYALARAPGGGMLIGTRRGLIWYANGRTRVYRTQDGLPGEVVFSLLPDGLGSVWVGTEHGLARWEGGRVTTVDRPELADLSIISMARDRRGRLWLGHINSGITILAGDSLRTLTAADGATNQTIWAMREDADGRMWVATNGDGALRIDDDGIRRFTTRDGLASDFIWQVLADARGDIWLFGNLGLDRFTGDRLTHYGRGSGLIELEGSAGAAHEDRSGNLWFGTGNGIVRFSPGLDVAPTVAPPVYIEEATHDGQSFPVMRAGTDTRVERGVVRLRFASPSFRDESVTRFRYRLIGADSGWSGATSEQSITYAGLAPGRYRFEVLATNGGVRSAAPATLTFTVLPAFWQTWWFRALGLVLVVGGAAVVPVLRARALERERRRLEALVAQHTHDLADKNARLAQSNRDLEHFAYVASHDLQEPLRKIQAFSDRVTKQYAERLDDQGRDYLDRMSGAAARMQRLIDALLSLSRVTTKRNPVEPIELRALAEDVLGDLEFRIQSTRGRVELGDLPRIAGDPVQMRQLFQNLIGNALKFHRPDETPVVTVTAVQPNARTVEIRVEDNGIGFESKDAERVFLPFHRLHGRTQYEGTGIGLTICQKIAERHGGVIRAESTPGKGSRFIVTLPLHLPIETKHAA